jgi:glycosyltransferase involved in cell wall biosynthesis
MPKQVLLTAEAFVISMRILWLTENYPPRRGGMAQACDRIVSNLRSHELQTDVAFFSAGARRHKTVDQQNGRFMTIPVSGNPGHDLNCFWNLLQQEHLTNSYSSIVAFGGNYPIIALPVFKAWMHCSSVLMLRGNDLDLGIFTPSRRGILENAIGSADAVCVLSLDQQKKVTTLFPNAPVFHIANGIDRQTWHTEECDCVAAKSWRTAEVTGERITIGIIGQLKSKKGIDFLLENVLSAGLHDRFHFFMIGDIDAQLEEWLSANGNGLSISRCPFLDRFELLGRYPACDYIALPSHYDGMPNVLLEAGLLEIPPIAARAGGIAEVIPESLYELTFHPGSATECRRALWHAASIDNEQRCQAGRLLKDRIESLYGAEKETLAYIDLFAHLHK